VVIAMKGEITELTTLDGLRYLTYNNGC